MLPISQNRWKFGAMAQAQLVQNSITPGDVPFLTLGALKVLGHQVVKTIVRQHLSDGVLVRFAAAGQLVSLALWFWTRETYIPQLIWCPVA